MAKHQAAKKCLPNSPNKCVLPMFEAMIAPHYVPNDIVLASQYYGTGLSEVRRGNTLAKNKKWPVQPNRHGKQLSNKIPRTMPPYII